MNRLPSTHRLSRAKAMLRGFLCLFLLVGITLSANIGYAIDRNAARFKKLLVGKNDSARVMAIKSVSQDFQSRLQALPVIVDALEELGTDSIFDRAEKKGLPNLPDGVALMIDFIGTIDREEATEALVGTLKSSRIAWSMASADTLARNKRHAAIDPIADMIHSEHFEKSYGFRFSIARALKQMEHPRAWEALARIYMEVDGQLAHRAAHEFKYVTLGDFENDEKRFHAWQLSVGLAEEPEQTAEITDDPETLPKKMSLGPERTAVSYREKKRLTPSKYYGIDIFAKRLLFVLDRSGSMSEMVRYRTRLERAKKELLAAIDGLDERCEFSILVFDSDVRAWNETLVKASPKNKTDAIRYVQRLGAGRSTNTYGALRTSIDFDKQLEAVFILTDGKPTTGLITSPNSILNDILRRNETRHITINTIGIAIDPMMQGFLQKLAEPSQGVFRNVP